MCTRLSVILDPQTLWLYLIRLLCRLSCHLPYLRINHATKLGCNALMLYWLAQHIARYNGCSRCRSSDVRRSTLLPQHSTHQFYTLHPLPTLASDASASHLRDRGSESTTLFMHLQKLCVLVEKYPKASTATVSIHWM